MATLRSSEALVSNGATIGQRAWRFCEREVASARIPETVSIAGVANSSIRHRPILAAVMTPYETIDSSPTCEGSIS